MRWQMISLSCQTSLSNTVSRFADRLRPHDLLIQTTLDSDSLPSSISVVGESLFFLLLTHKLYIGLREAHSLSSECLPKLKRLNLLHEDCRRVSDGHEGKIERKGEWMDVVLTILSRQG